MKIAEPQIKTNFVQLPIPANSSKDASSFMADMIVRIGNNVVEISNTVSEELLSKVLKVMANVK